MGRKKITIVGAGRVGSTVALWAASKELGDIVLVDILEDYPKGLALDLQEASPIENFDLSIVGSNSYEETANSDIAIITAGFPRKPGMSRDDLLEKNAGIVKNVTKEIVRYSPNAIIIVVTNPLDAMSYVAKKVSGFPRERVIGMAGALDSARMRTFIAMELDVSIEDVQALVLGGHGDSMVPLVRYSTVAGIPIEQLLPREKIEAIIERTRFAGGEIISLMKKASAFISPSAAIIQMVEAILKDKRKILPCSAYLEGEYGVENCYVGVPVKLGSKGIEEIIEVELTEEEKKQFYASVEEVKKLIKKIEGSVV
ncbi:MAG: malate dehydrogenase [Candidatus Hydrothermarchaeota archaeon]|nr:MAG: malate dehydrogenase [Candidatus Hydrothermarchaeota archaeon]